MQLALEKKERLPPSPCMHTASTWGEGKFCLDREFSKNVPYKQNFIFHLASSDKMLQKNFFLLGRWIGGMHIGGHKLISDTYIAEYGNCGLKRVS